MRCPVQRKLNFRVIGYHFFQQASIYKIIACAGFFTVQQICYRIILMKLQLIPVSFSAWFLRTISLKSSHFIQKGSLRNYIAFCRTAEEYIWIILCTCSGIGFCIFIQNLIKHRTSIRQIICSSIRFCVNNLDFVCEISIGIIIRYIRRLRTDRYCGIISCRIRLFKLNLHICTTVV